MPDDDTKLRPIWKELNRLRDSSSEVAEQVIENTVKLREVERMRDTLDEVKTATTETKTTLENYIATSASEKTGSKWRLGILITVVIAITGFLSSCAVALVPKVIG